MDLREGQDVSRVTLHVAESESGPGALSPGRLSVHGPTLLVTNVAAASSRLGFCPVHLILHKPAPSTCGGHSPLLSQFPHLLEGRGVPETPGPSQHRLSLIFSAGSTKGLIQNSRRGNGNPD